MTILRLSMGWIFLWAFLDKLPDWLKGESPTAGFLKAGTYGPLVDIYHALAGNPVVDWLFMLGLAGVGLALILGIGLKIAGYAGSLMMLLIYFSMFPPKNNPFLDEHIIYIIVLIGLANSRAGQFVGLGKWWSQTKLVQKFRFLE